MSGIIIHLWFVHVEFSQIMSLLWLAMAPQVAETEVSTPCLLTRVVDIQNKEKVILTTESGNFKITKVSINSFPLSPNAWNVFSMSYPLYSTGWFSLPPPHQLQASDCLPCGHPRGER